MSESLTLPILPLRGAVLFPGVSVPIGAGRPVTLKAIEAAMRDSGRQVFVLAQRENVEQVTPDLLYTVGTIAKVGDLQRGPNGVQLILHGQQRGIAVRISEVSAQGGGSYFEAVVREAEEMLPIDARDPAFVALYREARERAGELGKKSGLPDEIVQKVLDTVDAPGNFSDLVSAYVEMSLADRQMLLETLSVEERLRRVLLRVQRQIDVLDAQQEIKSQVQEELGDRQREMYLREQMKAIQNELGEGDDGTDLDELAAKLVALELPAAARKEVDREMNRLKRLGRESMEAQVVRTYLETVAELPWTGRTEDHIDIQNAGRILDEDHYGLQDVKDRVVEFLAVRQLRQAQVAAALAEQKAAAEATSPSPAEAAWESEGGAETDATGVADAPPSRPGKARQAAAERAAKGPILLFVGPPGVGKTSIAKGIARAMGREYVRISLGGARDEADIRGHRRTYVGAMPGRIIAGMKQAGTRNPVFLLDEVDKLGVSYQGDPSSALLEVLDPAQNDSFTDHYLGIPFDLSEVLFIATANFAQNIPGPLLDRMELVEFSGYTEAEKLTIARQYLLPRQRQENSLEASQIEVTDDAVAEVISRYTREAGVRQLERELGKLARKVARRVAAKEVAQARVDRDDVAPLLGRPTVHPEHAAELDQIGVATGMFYTPVGGDIMFVEATTMPGKGELVLTGQLGDVMKESARAAWSFARSHAADLGIDKDAFQRDVHVHVPAGAIPKEGPSAGVAMATALVSSLSGRPARHDVAMTGEITLTGRVLPIGGVKEKVLGAVRAGIAKILLPQRNVADLEDLPADVRASIEVVAVEWLGEALSHTLRGATFREGRLLFGEGLAEDLGTAKQHPLAH